ncbi:hypothetical protein D3C81_1429500 [compost metagenome]
MPALVPEHRGNRPDRQPLPGAAGRWAWPARPHRYPPERSTHAWRRPASCNWSGAHSVGIPIQGRSRQPAGRDCPLACQWSQADRRTAGGPRRSDRASRPWPVEYGSARSTPEGASRYAKAAPPCPPGSADDAIAATCRRYPGRRRADLRLQAAWTSQVRVCQWQSWIAGYPEECRARQGPGGHRLPRHRPWATSPPGLFPNAPAARTCRPDWPSRWSGLPDRPAAAAPAHHGRMCRFLA